MVEKIILSGGLLLHPTEKISSVDILNTLVTGAQDKESFSKDKSYSTFQESSIGCHVELYQPSKYKSSFLFGTSFPHHGITKKPKNNSL